eukprot:TRINITY_DN9206_c0_g1_i25.p1 TRINITY_DN9206_c0_g1~~TRINITY_DN9206_c0_g1_i25.p1  ORF type:complete len:178 (+),score=30.45 TRINITY_DN9206_c0_g1_i25:135-668(+)
MSQMRSDRVHEARSIIRLVESVNTEELPAYLSPYKEEIQVLSKKDVSYIFGNSPVISLLNKIGKKEFDALSNEFDSLPSKQANLTECIKIFLRVLESNDAAAFLSVVVGCIELFFDVSKKTGFVSWRLISNFMLTHYNESNRSPAFTIANKYNYKSEALKSSLNPIEYSKVFSTLTL